MKNKKHIITPALMFVAGSLFAQSKIKDGTITGSSNLPASSAILELESADKGLLLPRVALSNTTTWGLTGTPVAGMVVYDTATTISSSNPAYPILQGGKGTYYWDGTGWVGMKAGSEGWKLNGNAGTNAGTNAAGNAVDGNYWGTTDATRLVIGTNGTKRMIFDTMGNAWGGKNSIISNNTSEDLDNGGYPGTSFIWGISNTDSSYQNAIFGAQNMIAGHLHSNIIAGEKDTIGGYWGWGNAVFGVKNSVSVINGGGNVVGGIENKRIGTANSAGNGSAVFGFQNTDSSYFSSITGGSNNNLGTGAGNSIVGGSQNAILTPAFTGWDHGIAQSNAVFGSNNRIKSATSNSISSANLVSGNTNSITDANAVTALGYGNTDTLSRSSVLSGASNKSTNIVNSMVQGANNTARYSNQSVVFGIGNTDSASSNTLISGVTNHTALAAAVTVTGGSNTVTSTYASVIVGINNKDSASRANVLSGVSNTANVLTSSIVGGDDNKFYHSNSLLVSGYQHVDSNSSNCWIGGWGHHTNAVGSGAFISGNFNTVKQGRSFFVTGQSNSADNIGSTILSGENNSLYHSNGLISNGYLNKDSSANVALVSGVSINTNDIWGGAIVAGQGHNIRQTGSSAIFGDSNTVNGQMSVLLAGRGLNAANHHETVIGTYNKPVTNALFTVGNGTSGATRNSVLTVTSTNTDTATATANNSTLNINGSMSTAIATTGGDYVLTSSDYTVIYTGGSAAPTFTLPDPATCKGRMYRLVNASANTNYHDITFSRPVTLYSGQTTTTMALDSYISGAAANNTAIQNTALIQSDGATWWRVGL